VYYFYHGFPFEELVALYHMADIGLVTPLRDGMNLVAKEYLAAKREKAGVLILSEMAGAAIELNEALIINPNNIEEIENAIFTALEMPEEEQMRRLKKMQQSVSRKSVNKWANDFVNELKAINLRNENLNTERIDYQAKIKIQTEYRNSQKRLFILDYDGTLSAFKSRPEDAVPTKETYKLLNKLAADPKNKVVISSGRDRDTLEEWFGSLAIDLAAEHGACYKEHGVWVDNIGDEKPWDNEIMEIVQNFVDKTPRSKVEEKNTTLVWHYRNVDTWLASLREQQLFEALMIPCARLGLQIMRGNKIIEIKSPVHTKGSEARRLLATQNFDFIMAIGDDTTDEDTFRELPDFAYTIKVGNISEVARYSVKSQSKVLPLLDIISD
jgi:trehalose 6-phosphate synthase/phosphatase